MNTIGPMGRMISASKSSYRDRNPDNLAVFNSNLIILKDGEYSKVWFGDIDITLDRQKLKEIADKVMGEVIVLYEMDGRFENEDKPSIDKFVYRVTPEGVETLGKSTSEHYDNNMRRKIASQ